MTTTSSGSWGGAGTVLAIGDSNIAAKNSRPAAAIPVATEARGDGAPRGGGLFGGLLAPPLFVDGLQHPWRR